MIFIKKLKNILFFSIAILIIFYLLKVLGVISFASGLLKAIFPIVFALFISICMESIIGKFTKKGYSRHKVTLFSYGILIVLFGGFILLIGPSFIKQLQVFINTLPSLFEELKKLLANININFDPTNLMNNFQIRLDKVIDYFGNIVNVFVSIGIAFSASFFISYDYDKIKEGIKNRIPHIVKDELIYFFSKYLPFFAKYIHSLVIDSLITFGISFLLFTIFKVDYSIIGALIITITNLIPFIGTLLGIIPLVVIGYSISGYFAIISLVVVLVVQLIESNIIQPLVFKNVIRLHPVEGMLGVLAFSYLFGTLGMIFSPLLVVAFKILFIERYEKEESHFDTPSIQ